MDKWEYKVLRWLNDYKKNGEEESLNKWGQQGWELVCCAEGKLILKRKVQS